MLFAVNKKVGSGDILDLIAVIQYLLKTYAFIDPRKQASAEMESWQLFYINGARSWQRFCFQMWYCCCSRHNVTWSRTLHGNATNKRKRIWIDSDVTFVLRTLQAIISTDPWYCWWYNVYCQNAMALSSSLQLDYIPFEQMSYSNIQNIRADVFHSMYNIYILYHKCFKIFIQKICFILK